MFEEFGLSSSRLSRNNDGQQGGVESASKVRGGAFPAPSMSKTMQDSNVDS